MCAGARLAIPSTVFLLARLIRSRLEIRGPRLLSSCDGKRSFSRFEKLWNAVGVRLLIELLASLKSGKEVWFGPALIRDDGVTLPKHKFWGASERVRCDWYQAHIWNADGSFYIGAKEDSKVYAGLSYMDQPNTHILERTIRAAFEKPGMRVLSDILTGSP